MKIDDFLELDEDDQLARLAEYPDGVVRDLGTALAYNEIELKKLETMAKPPFSEYYLLGNIAQRRLLQERIDKANATIERFKTRRIFNEACDSVLAN